MRRIASFLALTLLAAAAALALPRDDRRATLAFVRGLQNPDGGFRAGAAAGPSSVGATTAGLRALKYLGGSREPRRAAGRFVEGLIQADGGIPDAPGAKPDARSTSQGLMALSEAGSSRRKDPDGKIRAFLVENARTLPDIYIAAAAVEAAGLKTSGTTDWVLAYLATANKDGTYGKNPSEHAGAVITLRRLGGKLADRKASTRALLAAQNPDGGWSATGLASDLPTTYRVMRALSMLEARPSLDRVRGFVRSCRNADGGYGPNPGEPSATGPTYFAAIVLHWVEEMDGPPKRPQSSGAYTGFPRIHSPRPFLR